MEILAEYKSKPVLEKYIQRNIVVWLREQGYHVDVITKGMYGANGIADIICCIKGLYVAFEVKRPGAKPTALQIRWLESVNKSGGEAFVVSSLSDVKEIING